MGDVVQLRSPAAEPPSSEHLLSAAIAAQHEHVIVIGIDAGEVSSVQVNATDRGELARYLRKVRDDIVGSISADPKVPPEAI